MAQRGGTLRLNGYRDHRDVLVCRGSACPSLSCPAPAAAPGTGSSRISRHVSFLIMSHPGGRAHTATHTHTPNFLPCQPECISDSLLALRARAQSAPCLGRPGRRTSVTVEPDPASHGASHTQPNRHGPAAALSGPSPYCDQPVCSRPPAGRGCHTLSLTALSGVLSRFRVCRHRVVLLLIKCNGFDGGLSLLAPVPPTTTALRRAWAASAGATRRRSAGSTPDSDRSERTKNVRADRDVLFQLLHCEPHSVKRSDSKVVFGPS